ncbi:MAG: metallophosphoesterase [bacterium]
MALDKNLAYQKLDALWHDPQVQALATKGKKYVIISDTHLGDGGKADDFHQNEKVLSAALDHYNSAGHILIMLGDIEEFWQFDLDQIVNRYRDSIYAKIKAFGDSRLIRLFGNHDLEWQSPADPAMNNPGKNKGAAEALRMKDAQGNARILLVHGHQGSIDSDKNSWISKFLVRGLFKPVEPLAKKLGLYGHTEATKSQITKDYEKILYGWAKSRKALLICGHSHRAIFASKSRVQLLEEEIGALQKEILENRDNKTLVKSNLKQIEKSMRKLLDERTKGREIDPTEKTPLPCYFNTGCGLYSDGITVMEIENDTIRLVKWCRKKTAGGKRVDPPYGEGNLSDFVGRLNA